MPLLTEVVLRIEGYELPSTVAQIAGFVIGPCLAFQQALFALNPSIEGGLFGLPLIGDPWVYVGILGLQAILYMVFTVMIENRQASVNLQPMKIVHDPDIEEITDFADDLIIEDNKMSKEKDNNPIHVKDLLKVYPTGQQAVRGLSFGVGKGEIFGLLGPNGAGKSTTFNMITQLIGRSGGEIALNGKSLDSNKKSDIYKDCGVCPQFDPLWDLLNVREHLVIFGKIKGLGGRDLEENIDYFMDILRIRQHQKKRTYQLSGGNKRRLCVALASLGAPVMQFMDEPSTGLDPLGRVHLWETIRQTLQLRNSSIVLTTHSMPEAESLCSKIGTWLSFIPC